MLSWILQTFLPGIVTRHGGTLIAGFLLSPFITGVLSSVHLNPLNNSQASEVAGAIITVIVVGLSLANKHETVTNTPTPPATGSGDNIPPY